MSSTPQATIVITTRNRKEELRTALRSAVEQAGDVEIIVVDDASTDGTADLVRTEFPQVRLHVASTPQGYIAQRNFGAKLACAPIIVSIDDDAAFTSPQTVARAVAQFDHPRIGAVTLPFVNVNESDRVLTPPPGGGQMYVNSTYVGTAHALRRDIFLKLGGYHEQLIHFGEEADFTMRLLAAGYVTRMASAPPIHHFVSPKRQVSRSFVERGRSHVLSAWYNDPARYLLPHWMATTFNMFRHGVRCGHPIWAMQGVTTGLFASLKQWNARSPISPAAYRLYRELHLGGPRPFAQIESRLPAMAFPELAHVTASAA